MSTVIKAHRGPSTYMNSGEGASLVLAEGELFVEYPDAGISAEGSKLKIGDGVSTYSNLPYIAGSSSGGGGGGEGGVTPSYVTLPVNPPESAKVDGSIWLEDDDAPAGTATACPVLPVNPDEGMMVNGNIWIVYQDQG